jgi:uncharacterized repeat protein (TIGR03803 family)
MTISKNYRVFMVALQTLFMLYATLPATAQTYSVLYNFGTKSGDALAPQTGFIVQGRDGSLYSTANAGGANNWGAVLKVTPAGKEIVLYSFCSVANCTDGNSPVGGLTLRADGHLLGTTTSNGPGAGNGAGTVFDVSETGTLTTLHTFIGTDGSQPVSAPILGPDGSFYGVTLNGGNRQSCGTLYRITGSKFSVLHYFDEADGCGPTGALVLGTDGNLYGTAQFGGSQNDGGVYQVVLRPGKSTIVNWLFTFNGNGGPVGALIEGSDGNFYGTTEGRDNGSGSIFRITSTGSLTILHALNGTTDGSDLQAGLVQATDGNFYGVAPEGGAYGAGTLFQVTPAGGFSVLHNFGAPNGSFGIVDATPLATPVQNTNGLLFGDTASGGTGTGCNGEEGCGVFYSWNDSLPAFVSTVPSMGAVGSFVQILGQGFTSASTVSFNGTAATPVVVSGTYLRTTVPSGATTGSITVTTSSGTLTSNKQFIVTP